jgi:hypothetical protein
MSWSNAAVDPGLSFFDRLRFVVLNATSHMLSLTVMEDLREMLAIRC